MTILKVDMPRSDAAKALGSWAEDVTIARRDGGQPLAVLEGEFTAVQLRLIARVLDTGGDQG